MSFDNRENCGQAILELAIPDRPHAGFEERHNQVTLELRNRLLGALTAQEFEPIEGINLQGQFAELFSHFKTELTVYNATRSIDDYLNNHPWRYAGERDEAHQELALIDVLNGIAHGHREGYIEQATSIGKTYVAAKLAEAFYKGDLRVLILTPTKTIGQQFIGHEADKGLTRFAPTIEKETIGQHFNNVRAKPTDRVVISTYQSLNNFAQSGELGEFDIILADEAHRSLGEKTAGSLKAFSPHAVKIGLTATPVFGMNKSVDEILPRRYHRLDTQEAIQAGLTAPVQSLLYATHAEIPDLDPRRAEFTPRELQRLIHLKSRNNQAIQLARNFIQEGRQGIIPCLPGEDLAHARLVAEELSRETVNDAQTGDNRQIVAKAIGNFNYDEVPGILQAYERGEVDVLTFVNLIGEGWDSQAASFMINTCPTTSVVKLTQQLGRILRKKKGGLHSIAVDFIDESIGKEQKTVLHVLGQEKIELGKLYGKSKFTIGLDAHTYLRGILDPDLYSRLLTVDGQLVQDLVMRQRERRQRHVQDYYERILAKEGLAVDTHPTGIPEKFLQAVTNYENEFLMGNDRLPRLEETVVHFIENENTSALGIPRRDSSINIRRALMTRTLEQYGLSCDVSNDSKQSIGKDPADVVEPILLKESVDKALSALNKREQRILRLRFGLEDGKPRTYEEIGKYFNLTRERIRQIESVALSSLLYPTSDLLYEWLHPSDTPSIPVAEISETLKKDEIFNTELEQRDHILKSLENPNQPLLTRQELALLPTPDRQSYQRRLQLSIDQVKAFNDDKRTVMFDLGESCDVDWWNISDVMIKGLSVPELYNKWDVKGSILERINARSAELIDTVQILRHELNSTEELSEYEIDNKIKNYLGMMLNNIVSEVLSETK